MPLLRKIFIGLLTLQTVSCTSILKQEDAATIIDVTPVAQPSISKEAISNEPIAKVWSKSAVNYFNQGNSQLKSDPDKAIEAFQQAINIEPQMEAAYYNLMRLYFSQNDYQRMQQLLKRAEQESVQSARILTLMGTNQRQSGKFSEAEQYYNQAIAKDEHYLAALANMAILQDLYLHKLSEAQNYYQKYHQQLQLQGVEDKRITNWLADIKQRLSKLERESNK